MKPTRHAQDLRLTSSLWISVLGWIGLGILFIDLLLGQQWSLIWAYAPGIGIAAWALHFFFFAPRIRVEDDHAEVRNVWMTTRIPYSRIKDITIRLMVRITYLDQNNISRQITSWSAPGLPRPLRGGQGHSQFSGHGEAGFGGQISPSQILADTWERHTGTEDDQVTRKVHWPELMILGVLIILALLPKG